MKFFSFIVIILTVVFSTDTAYPKTAKFQTNASKESIFNIVNVPEDKIDVGYWALVIAKEFNPKVNIESYLSRLNSYAEEIKKMLAGRTKDMDKFLSVKTFLYDKGLWNENKPFSYDLNDPMGEHIENQLLSSYLDTRKGNCVSMPTLFLALMQRVAPEVKFNGVKAPMHLFCRLKDKQTGDVWNVETTNGGNPARNQWYMDQMHITQTAVNKGLFLKDLTKKQYIAELLSSLISKERKNGNLEKAIKYTELVLKLSPNSDLGLVSKCSLMAEMGYRLQQSKIENMTDEDKKKMEFYKSESEKYFSKAKALGWKSETKEERESYIMSVKQNNNK